MNLDQHLISIRRRNFAGICDLAWLVIRNYWLEVLVWISVTAIPLSFLNYWLIDLAVDSTLIDETNPMFGLLMVWFVFLESQVATLFLTAWIGRLMFHQSRNWKAIVRDVASCWLRVFWVQGILRPAAIFLPLYITLDARQGISNEGTIFFVVLIALILVVVRWARPFANEIIILERTPIFRNKNNKIAWSRRSRSLHGSDSSMVMSSEISGAMLNLMLVMCLYSFLMFLEQVLVLGISGEWWTRQLFWTISLWFVVAYSAIVRFLSYIDIRSRQEGWDLELKIRAEEKRLALSE